MPSDSYTSEPKPLDNYADAEFQFATLILQAKHWGCAVRDPGPGQSIEMIAFNPEAGQWALIPIEPLRALSLAEDLIRMASRRL